MAGKTGGLVIVIIARETGVLARLSVQLTNKARKGGSKV